MRVTKVTLPGGEPMDAKRVAILAAVACVGCGDEGGSSVGDAHGVSITQATRGDCPNGGFDINQGVDKNGNGALDPSEVTATETVCNGQDGQDGADGPDGKDGEDGQDGKDGEDGDSCTVVDNGDSTKTISCEDGTSATVYDGVDSIWEVNAMALWLRSVYGAAVLDVMCYVDEVHVASGTGVKTDSGTLISAHHVIESCHATAFYSSGVYVGGGGTWLQFGTTDVVEVSNVSWNAIGQGLTGVKPHYHATPVLGELVYGLSYPGVDLRNDVQVMVGRVVDDNVNDSLSGQNASYWRNVFTTDYAATAGSSGAPVFDRFGDFIGIHVGGYDNGLEINYTLPLQNE
jgi:S1-C subfamily serine protease